MASVQFSSAASLFGAPGQGNYAAANAALEAHSAAATSMGIRQMAIQWGAWAAGKKDTPPPPPPTLPAPVQSAQANSQYSSTSSDLTQTQIWHRVEHELVGSERRV